MLTKFYFIHYIDSEYEAKDEDSIPLNGLGYLYIGYGGVDEKNYEEIIDTDNTFLSINEARIALDKIRKALATKKAPRPGLFPGQ